MNQSDINIIPKFTVNEYKNQFANSYINTYKLTFAELVKYLAYTIVSNGKFDNHTFIIGEMSGTHRNDDNVINRGCLALDIDDLPADTNLIEEIENRFNFSWILYSTFSHTADKPRFRLIIPLSKPITKKYYKHAIQLFEKQLGVSVDDKSFTFSQCMARAVKRTEEAEHVFKYHDSYFIDTDKLTAGLKIDKEQAIEVSYTGLKRDSSYWSDIGFGVSSGSRNNALASITGHLARKGVDINLIIGLLTTWNMQNDPPIPHKEFERTIRSIITKEQKRTRREGG